jgi:hypothetical protein
MRRTLGATVERGGTTTGREAGTLEGSTRRATVTTAAGSTCRRSRFSVDVTGAGAVRQHAGRAANAGVAAGAQQPSQRVVARVSAEQTQATIDPVAIRARRPAAIAARNQRYVMA